MIPAERVVLITGAAAGLAKGIAIDLAHRGYRIALCVRPGGTSSAAVCEAVRSFGGEPFVCEANFTQSGSAERIVRETETHFGRLDAVVHAVGPMIVKRFARCTIDDYHTMIDANLASSVEIAFAALPGMRERKFGRLVFFGMNGSHSTHPARGLSLYGAAKAGVVCFARTLALEEAAHGISVNVIEPGDIRQKELGRGAARMIPAKNPTGRAGSWEDVASAVRFVLAEDADFLNGMVLGVHGGMVDGHE